MRLLISALVVGFLFVWGLEHVPNMMGYMFVGIVVILILRQFKK